MAQHTVVVRHGRNGNLRTEVTGNYALASWTNKRQNGVTVRTDHSDTHRFYNARVEDAFALDTLF